MDMTTRRVRGCRVQPAVTLGRHVCVTNTQTSRPFLSQRASPHTTTWTVNTAAAAQAEKLIHEQEPNVLGSESQEPIDGPRTAREPTRTFPWTEHWYPVAIVDNLDPCRPHATHLLGIPLALWRDKQGTWHAVEDKCPHRLAPLSEGRIEPDGTLQCSYHGWQFDGRGACTHIPQLRGDPQAMQVACTSRRSCVRAFPVQVVHGLLWVRPDSSQQAHEEFAKNPAPPNTAVKELLGGPEAEGFRQTTQWYMRDVPMRFDTLCENILDPSHVPFAHHKVQGNRNSEKGTTTKLLDEISLEGFDFELDFQNPRFGASVPVFKAPNFIRYGNPIRSMNVFAVPTRPGWSRIYVTFMKDTRQPGRLPWLVEKLYSLVEKTTWLEHITQRHPVLDGDNYILHLQERALHEQHNSDWQKSFYMPAAADTSTVAIRRWFDTFGGAVPTCEPRTPLAPRLTKRETLDRYSQHTVHCRHCQKALRNVELATAVVAAAGVLVGGWLAARALMGAPLLSSAAGMGLLVAALAGMVVAGLRSLRQQFFFVDYVHAARN